MSVYQKQRKDGSKAWYYDFMYNGIRYRGVVGTTKTQAIRTLDKKRTEILNSEHGLVKKVGNPQIEDFDLTYLKRRKHLQFHERDALCVKNLLKYFRGKKLMSVTASNIENYIGKRLEDGVSPSTINRELTCLKRIFSLAITWGEANNNPVKDIKFLEEPPGRTRFLSEDEAQRLIDCSSIHLKPIIITALNTGMRLGEILSLKWNHVHIEKVIDPSIELEETKRNRRRFIPLNDDMVELFDNLRHANDDLFKPSEYVFLSTFGKPLLSVKKPFQNALKKSEIKDFRFHNLRHTFS